jgi:NADPH-dependent F420 reductase
MKTIAILGGTGAEGFGLAKRLGRAGMRVLIGSRDIERAQTAAAQVPGSEGHLNADAVSAADIVILTVPLTGQISTLKSVKKSFRPGSILVDATVPLEVSIGGRVSRTVTLWSGSAAQQAAQHVAEGVAVVAAFHSLSAELLSDLEQPVDSDVLICGDSSDAKAAVAELVSMLPGARPIEGGPLENARLAENLAVLLISLNIRHKVKHTGIRITGLP